jgi:hypothetical protein
MDLAGLDVEVDAVERDEVTVVLRDGGQPDRPTRRSRRSFGAEGGCGGCHVARSYTPREAEANPCSD